MPRTRKNHPDFFRKEFEPGDHAPEAGDWYVGRLWKCSRTHRSFMDSKGLNYFDGDGWVRLHVVDSTFEPSA